MVEPLDADPPGCVTQHLGAESVRPHEQPGVKDRETVVGLRGEVHHHIHAVFLDRLHHSRAVADVGFEKGDPILNIRQIRAIPGIGQQVDRHDLVVRVMLDPMPNKVRADEPGGAGHKERRHQRDSRAPGPAPSQPHLRQIGA